MDYATDPAQLSTAELLRELAEGGRTLARTEVERLKDDGATAIAEARARLTSDLTALREDMKEQVGRVGKAAKPMAIGGVLAHAGMYFLLGALTLGLGRLMPLWLAALIVGVVVAGVGGILLKTGADAAKAVGRQPLQRTQHMLMENKRWMTETKGKLGQRLHAALATLKHSVSPTSRPSSGAGLSQAT